MAGLEVPVSTDLDKWFMGKAHLLKNWTRVQKEKENLLHPSQLTSGGYHFLFLLSLNSKHFKKFVPYLSDIELECVEAVLYGRLRGRAHWSQS